MLTQKQIEKLQPLTQHPKFGKILTDAIEIWKHENVIPQKRVWGIYLNSNNHFEFIYDNCACCLLGAAIMSNVEFDHYVNDGRPTEYLHIENLYQISDIEIKSLFSGFDNMSTDVVMKLGYFNEEAFKFGNIVGKIVIENG